MCARFLQDCHEDLNSEAACGMSSMSAAVWMIRTPSSSGMQQCCAALQRWQPQSSTGHAGHRESEVECPRCFGSATLGSAAKQLVQMATQGLELASCAEGWTKKSTKLAELVASCRHRSQRTSVSRAGAELADGTEQRL